MICRGETPSGRRTHAPFGAALALRAPDHLALRPLRFVHVGRDERTALGTQRGLSSHGIFAGFGLMNILCP